METVRSSLGIREMLFSELDQLRNGKTSPQRASAVAKISSQILSTVKVELEYARFAKDNSLTPGKMDPLQLG